MAVGLGEDQGDAGEHGGYPCRAGDEAAAAEYHVGAPTPEHAQRRPDGTQRLDARPRPRAGGCRGRCRAP